VIDYRGPHGVRLVHKGVLNNSGMWVGRLGFGDATDGAVKPAGESVDRLDRIGRTATQVQLDHLPASTSELFFALSAPFHVDLPAYEGLQIRLWDGENPSHELLCKRVENKFKGATAVMCGLRRTSDRIWHFFNVSHGGCGGDAHNYQQLLQDLRALQERKHSTEAWWPYFDRDDIVVRIQRRAEEKRAAEERQHFLAHTGAWSALRDIAMEQSVNEKKLPKTRSFRSSSAMFPSIRTARSTIRTERSTMRQPQFNDQVEDEPPLLQ